MFGAALLMSSDHAAEVAWHSAVSCAAAERLPAMDHELGTLNGKSTETPSLPGAPLGVSKLSAEPKPEMPIEPVTTGAAFERTSSCPGRVMVAPFESEPAAPPTGGCSGSTESVHVAFEGNRMIPLSKTAAGALTDRYRERSERRRNR